MTLLFTPFSYLCPYFAVTENFQICSLTFLGCGVSGQCSLRPSLPVLDLLPFLFTDVVPCWRGDFSMRLSNTPKEGLRSRMYFPPALKPLILSRFPLQRLPPAAYSIFIHFTILSSSKLVEIFHFKSEKWLLYNLAFFPNLIVCSIKLMLLFLSKHPFQ